MRSGARPSSPKARGPLTGASTPAAGRAGPAVERDVLEQAVAESPDGMLAFDRDGRVTLWNPAMERILDAAAADAEGRPAAELLPAGPGGESDALVRAALAGIRGEPRERALPGPAAPGAPGLAPRAPRRPASARRPRSRA